MAFTRFPRSAAKIEQTLKLLSGSLPEHALKLEISQAELDQLSSDAQNYGYLMDFGKNIQSAKESFFSYKDRMMEGGGRGALSTPQFPVFDLPADAVEGIVPRLRKLIRKIKASPEFTSQIGEALGLIVDSPAKWDSAEGSPELRLKPLPDGRVEIKFRRHGQDAIRIDFRASEKEKWQLAGVFTASPAYHQPPQDPEGRPQALQYRAILLRKNQTVGKFSGIYSIVVAPSSLEGGVEHIPAAEDAFGV